MPSNITKRQEPELSWRVGVPVGSNPLILLDFASILVVAFLLAWLVLLAAQFYFDGFVTAAHVWSGAIVAFDFCVLLAIFYAVVCFLVMRNRYAALYRFDRTGAHCDNLKCYPKALEWKALHCLCYPIDPPPFSPRSVEKHVAWSDVARVAELRPLRVLLLKGRRGTLMRVYCPDGGTYAAALRFVEAKIAAEQAPPAAKAPESKNATSRTQDARRPIAGRRASS